MDRWQHRCIFLLLVNLISFGWQLFAQDWELREDRNNIKVYTRKVADFQTEEVEYVVF